jgi:ADP-heptose:LPS heptosyltransferase
MIKMQIKINNIISVSLLSFNKILFKNIHRKQEKNNLLLVKAGHLGDIVLTTFVFQNKSVFSRFNKTYIILNKAHKNLFSDYDGEILLIFLDYRQYKYNIFYRFKFIKHLQSLGVKVVFNISFGRRILEDEITLLAGADSTYAFGDPKHFVKSFKPYIDKQYTKIIQRVSFNDHGDMIHSLSEIAGDILNKETKIFLNTSRVQYFYDLLNSSYSDRIKVCIAPLSSMNIKDWGDEKFMSLINSIAEYKAEIFILGTKKQKARLQKYVKINPKIIHNLAGKYTLINNIALMSNCDLFIGLDSGFTHVAKALKIDYVGIIGGGSVGICFPYNKDSNTEVLLYNPMPCFSCHWKCTLSEPFCLTKVEVDKVKRNIVNKLILLSENYKK